MPAAIFDGPGESSGAPPVTGLSNSPPKANLVGFGASGREIPMRRMKFFSGSPVIIHVCMTRTVDDPA